MESSSALDMIYQVCFFLGLGFAVLSALLTDLFHHGDIGLGQADASGGNEGGGGGGGGDTGGFHFPILSPITIATLITSFGGAGILLGKFVPEWSPWLHVPAATIAGVLTTGIVLMIFYLVFKDVEGSSSPKQSELIGLEAEVVVSIPKQGAGQIRYAARGAYFTGIGRSEEGAEIRQGDKVRIIKTDKGVFFVRKIQN